MPQTIDSSQPLTPRWTPLRPHPVQLALMQSTARFAVVPAGRRSGKTERAKRKLVRAALLGTEHDDPHFFAGAPTRDQAKRLYWDDLKKLTPPALMADKSESELVLTLINNSRIHVIGLDKPERMEGSPWDGGILDEYANMKPKAWQENIRPSLSDRRGWCWLIGVPEGRNHYYDLYDKALKDTTGEWAAFHWKSSDILDADEIASAKADMDEMTYLQEYEASFLNFQGRAYYKFERSVHCSDKVAYNPRLPLIFCFDFNVSPGVAAVMQEHAELPNKQPGIAIIGEVYIPQHSNTPAVCRKLIADWGQHKGDVLLYGDSTGGAKGSAKIMGSDWDLIRAELRGTFPAYKYMVAPNPRERLRVNSVNARLMSTTGLVRVMVNPIKCPNIVRDFEGVICLKGGSGEIDKDADPRLTHISDALGYYIVQKYPVTGNVQVHSF